MKFGDEMIYNGKSSKDFGLILVSFDVNDNSGNLGLNKEIIKGESTKFRITKNHFGSKYSDELSFQVSFIKNTCNNKEQKFSRDELRKITSWLSSNDYPKELYFVDKKNDIEPIYYFGIFTELNPFVLDGVYGLTATFTCDSPYGYTKLYSYICNNGETIVINNTSDEIEKPVYPLIKISPNQSGDVRIENLTERKFITIKVKSQNVIYLDCENTTAYDELGLLKLSDLGFTINELENFYWFRLLYDENKIKTIGDATVTFMCRYPRKVGEF